MNGSRPVAGGRFGHLQARRSALQAAHEQAVADSAGADQAVATLASSRRRPSRDLLRQAQRERDRLTTRRVTIATELRQVEADLVALHERLEAVQAELAQLDQRDHPVTAAMSITHYSERFFALRRELRDLVGTEESHAR